ncbi:MAG: OmpH family outer membrane protein [Chloracidobacterium sp.]|nr:OmpH family outer membrane protein [Chloracidobacterium sp.]MDW8218856.1 OmpH family outer membrane protein [Acidobacteriota bacterium]
MPLLTYCALGLLSLAGGDSPSAPTVAAVPTTQQPTAGQAVGPRIAVVNTQAFGELINEYRQQVATLQTEFRPTVEALQRLSTEIQAEEDALRRLADQLSPDVRLKRTDELERKKKDLKRRQEDLNEAAEKRAAILLNPVREKITKALEAYAKERGILILLDVATAAEAGGVVYLAPGMDITEDFAARYNQANPAGTSR